MYDQIGQLHSKNTILVLVQTLSRSKVELVHWIWNANWHAQAWNELHTSTEVKGDPKISMGFTLW